MQGNTERVLHALLESSADGLCVLDARGAIAMANAVWLASTGFTAAEAIGRDLWALFPETPAEMRGLHDAARAGQTVLVPPHAQIQAGTGREVWYEGRIVPVALADGVGLLITAVDITARRRAEEAKQASEARHQAALDGMLEGCQLIGFDWRYLYVNASLLRFARRRADEMLGRTMMEVHPGFERTPLFALLRQCMEARTPHRLETCLEYGDGTAAWFDISIQPRPEGVFVHAIEITDRKRAEAALRASEERFRQLAETIREVFWLYDLTTRKLVYVSPAYDTIWGRPRAQLEASPRDWLEAIHADDRARVQAALPSTRRTSPYDEEYRIVRPDGAVRWIHDRGFPVCDAAGAVVRFAGVAEDITARRDLEAQLLQTQKLQSVGLLAGGVAHDFNNLLTVIRGNTELLRAKAAERADVGDLLGEIELAGERAAALTRQLLAFGRHETIEPRACDLAEVVAEATPMLQRLLGDDIALHVVRGAEPARIDVAPGSWVQVLVNLAVNARDAMPRGGAFTIATGSAVIDAAFARARPGLAAGRCATLTVSDTGTGIAPEVAPRIFDAFFTTKAVGRGSGLGLSVVHGIVARSGGYIELSSAPGKGTTFRIYVPAVAEAPPAVVAKAPEPATRGGETLLVVEDEECIRKLMHRTLGSQGYSLLLATDGEDALRIVAEHKGPIDLLLTDVVMPRMSGRELVDALRPHYPDIPVLYTSGYTNDDVVRLGVRHEDVAFLAKPYTPLELRRKVRSVLDSR